MAYIGASVRLLQSVRYILCATPLTTGSSHDDDDQTRTLRIVLLGQSGSGKCSTANSLVYAVAQKRVLTRVFANIVHRFKTTFKAERRHHPYKVFETGEFGDPPARHRQCQSVTVEAREFSLKELQIVVTPGLRKYRSGYMMNEFCNFVTMSVPGPHAFLLCVRIGFSDFREVVEQINAIKELLGERFANHAVIVFTGADILKDDGRTIKEFVATLEGDFKQFIDECKDRYVAFDNEMLWGAQRKPSSKDRLENTKQSQELINAVTKLVDENNGNHFSNVLYDKASQLQEDHKDADEEKRVNLLLESQEMNRFKGRIQKLNPKYKL